MKATKHQHGQQTGQHDRRKKYPLRTRLCDSRGGCNTNESGTPWNSLTVAPERAQKRNFRGSERSSANNSHIKLHSAKANDNVEHELWGLERALSLAQRQETASTNEASQCNCGTMSSAGQGRAMPLYESSTSNNEFTMVMDTLGK